MSGTGSLDLAAEALRAGADGFLPKTARPEALAGPLWTIAEGMRVVDAKLLDALLARSREPNATVREQFSAPELRLWRFVAMGMETGDIAHRMTVSERTAKRMVAALLSLRKLGVTNRVAAAALAGQLRLLDDVFDVERWS
ncbi:MAG: LuxR C-terminal-related transcriptional regulator [Nocardiaceae bacterium]|nr:LuxR C-terminal-related transcriptional regulator [Nocardiaceae bacterium]